MSRFPKVAATAGASLLLSLISAQAQDVAAGQQAFRQCGACHMVGPDAASRVGPHLNGVVGREAGGVDGFNYSAAMNEKAEEGLVWNDESLAGYLKNPREFMPGTRMAFPGVRNDDDLANIIAYLSTFDETGEERADAAPVDDSAIEIADESGDGADGTIPADEPLPQDAELPADEPENKTEQSASGTPDQPGAGKHLALGRIATAAEVSAWDIDIRPDGEGLPVGRGTVEAGMEIYDAQCGVCHGDFGEAIGRWPVLAGGQGTLENDRPEKTVGSYWPYLSTVYDYVRRAMPFGNAQSLNDDEVYALTAYILYLNDVVLEEDFELSNENFLDVPLPNEANFIDDDRLDEPHYAEGIEPCMSDCAEGAAEIVMHAAVLDVTPDTEGGEEAPGAGIE
jgi:S-disulfanyl-L-cysteine oxidoreductase SoxD